MWAAVGREKPGLGQVDLSWNSRSGTYRASLILVPFSEIAVTILILTGQGIRRLT